MRPPRLVIFDCDGVLVDSEPIASRLLAEALTELGFPLTQRQVLDRYTGISMKSVLVKIEAEWGQPLPVDFAERMRRRDYAAFRRELKPVPGVPDMLARLRYPKCVASSGTPEKMGLTLGVTGLLSHFAPHIFSATMVPRGKPAPDLFLHAAREMGAAPAACAVIEDSVAGIRAALAAGMRALGFCGGGHAGAGYAQMLEGAGAHVVFADMCQLPELLG